MDASLKILSGVAVILPLLGSCIWFWAKNKIGEKITGLAATGTLVISFICCLTLFWQIESSARVEFFSWIWMGSSELVNFSFLLDPLSLALGLIVTGVGSLIHLYATGYMHGDEGFGRFFSYLNLFIFAMLMLIWSDSMPGIFMGWEGVGLCSYLLISFWFSDEANATAGKKAFIVNRVGDFGFLVAMFCIFKAFGTLSIPEVLAIVNSGNLDIVQVGWTQWACLGLVLGAAGKSAQIPLYVWLPDAMAGPTPVSALIHAATMVTAGVYLCCRLQPLFFLNPGVMELIAYIGGLTALFAASIAIFQNDIKKVLAYSTISQLGYMFLAVGLAAPVAAYFHLMTHAFFKALLFLGAGSVIHGLHHEQDMRKMGGLRKQMPITFWTMTIGVLAIAGTPPFAGFFSKDEILHIVSGSHRGLLSNIAFVTAFMTAFYMGRLWIMTFFGKSRGHREAHESPWSMTAVLCVLAALSAFGGLLNWPELWGGNAWLEHYLGQVVTQMDVGHGADALEDSLKLAGFSSLMGLGALGLAWWKYRDYQTQDFRSPAFNLFKNKYYIDEFYDAVIVRNLKRSGEFLWKVVDQGILDGTLNGLAYQAKKTSERFRRLQNGLLQGYALWIWLGVLILMISAWSVR